MAFVPMTRRFLQVFLLFWGAQVLPSLAQQAQTEDYSLSAGYGYLLLEYQFSNSTAKLELERLDRRRRRPRSPLVLKNSDARFELTPLPAGDYQVLNVSVPYFDLPYRKDVSEDDRWRFTIEAGKVNYGGALLVAPERSMNYVDIQLRNRWATSVDAIESTFGHVLKDYPLTLNMAYRDPFPAVLESLNAP